MVNRSSNRPLPQRAAASSLLAYRQWCLLLIASLVLMERCHANDVVKTFITSGRTDDQFKEYLEKQATQKVETARIACGLSSDEAEKLRDAAMGDVQRAMHEMAAMRHAAEQLDMANPNDARAAYQLAQPLMIRTQTGLHEKGSLFAKYLEHVLNEPQRDRYLAYLAEKDKQRHHVHALYAVAAINERVPLVKAQRDKLMELIEGSPIPKLNRNIEFASGYLRLANIPEHRLTEFLDEDQAKSIVRMCEPYRRMRWELP